MQKAFSLIELSIVIVIISVIMTIGLKSSEIVKNYELKRIMALTEEYENGFKAFYQIYNVVPGDTNKGYNLFADNNCIDVVIASNKKGCNGDDDGIIDISESTHNTDHYESILAFYHLFKAKLIAYDNNNDLNIANSSGNNNISSCNNKIVFNSEVNVPALGLRNSLLLLYKLSSNDISLLVSSGLACNISDFSGVFTVEELLSLERKYDDNLPESGMIQTLANSTVGSSNLCFVGADYNLALAKVKSCNLIYKFNAAHEIVNEF